MIIPRSGNKTFLEVERSIVDYINEVQNYGFNVSHGKHQFKDREINCGAETIGKELKASLGDADFICVCSECKTFFPVVLICMTCFF